MSPVPKLTQPTATTLTPALKEQLGVLATLLALLLLVPLALENASVPVRLGVVAVLLPITVVWYTFTAPPPSASNDASVQPAQWARWAQYFTIAASLIYAQHIMGN